MCVPVSCVSVCRVSVSGGRARARVSVRGLLRIVPPNTDDLRFIKTVLLLFSSQYKTFGPANGDY